jgi:hypothetical protein
MGNRDCAPREVIKGVEGSAPWGTRKGKILKKCTTSHTKRFVNDFDGSNTQPAAAQHSYSTGLRPRNTIFVLKIPKETGRIFGRKKAVKMESTGDL